MLKKENKVLTPQLYVFLICLLISTSIWVSIKLSHEHDIVSNIDISIVNETGFIIIDRPDIIISAKIRSGGFDLLMHKWFNKTPRIILDIKDVLGSKAINDGTITFSKYYLKTLIEAEFDASYNVLSFSPETLSFTIASPDTLKLAIEPILELSYLPQYKQYGKILIIPDSIEVYGPAEVLKKIDKVTTESIILSDISEDFSIVAGIRTSPEFSSLTFSHVSAEISIDVEKFTEATIILDVFTDSIFKENPLRLYTREAEVRYLAAFKDYNRIRSGLFLLIPDTTDMFQEGKQKLRLLIARQPEYVQIIDIKPAEVEFIFLEN